MSTLNHGYARVVGGVKTYAPAQFFDGRTVVTNPDEETYRSHGWLPVDRSPAPEPRPGYAMVAAGDEERDGMIRTVWEEVEVVRPPKVWRKIIFWRWLCVLGKWGQFKAILEAHDLVDAWNSTNDLQEDFDLGNGVTVGQFLLTVKPMLDIPDETWNRILSEAEAGNA